MGLTPFEVGQRGILERVARGEELRVILSEIVQLIERQASGMLCSIMLLDEDGMHIRVGAAPSLAPEYLQAIEGLAIGPTSGSCGAAAFQRERVIVEDIATHPNWEAYRDFALPHGLRACWSTPIVGSGNEVLGTFAMYYLEPRGPLPHEMKWVDAATHLASVALFRGRADERLRRSALVYDNLEDVVFYIGVDGHRHFRFLFVNPAFEKATGLPASSVVGRLVTDVIPPESHELVLGRYAEAIATRAKVRWEEVSIYPNGIKYGDVTVSPLFDTDGVCHHLVGVVHDVTARKNDEREREQLQIKLAQAQRLQALGTLAGGVAHDFNNMLTVILSYAELVGRELQGGPLADDLREIHRAATRASEMTGRLLAFSRQQVLEPKVLHLNEVLAGMNRMLTGLLRADVDLAVMADANLSNVSADPTQVEQVIMNLVVNARDAMPEGGKVTIETKDVMVDGECAHRHLAVPAGRYAMLTVSDTGIGMDSATQARIFEPFFTTKGAGKGTGLGLATVFGIVNQSGGHIRLDSAPGRGATFTIYLPAVDAEADDVGEPVTDDAPLSGNETVLLVEADDQVRGVTKGILRGSGYTVLEASRAGEAMLIIQQHIATIDLLLTGVVIPRQLRQLRPAMKVLFMSGSLDDGSQQGMRDSDAHYLRKPITPKALRGKIREVLEGG
ncbi:MAG: ATP-binding protein [Myxococcota bacterium]